MNIQQLVEQYVSAHLCVSRLEDAIYRNPQPGLIESLVEARQAEEECKAELQKALWLEIGGEA